MKHKTFHLSFQVVVTEGKSSSNAHITCEMHSEIGHTILLLPITQFWQQYKR